MEIQGSFSVAEWCQFRRLSRAMFYKLDAEGKAPVSYTVGKRRMISREADAAWLRAREAEAAEAVAA